ncbi:MAG TPA: hypothetical protein VKR61_23035 [Bryobacteraceae bacterium]|nr:hypothetical protein [Bryobacteraceae bacterium]
MKWLIVLMSLFALSASAADIGGNWKGTAETANGTITRTFVFKVDGHKLTGETNSDRFGKSTIEDGTVDGDNVAFHITVSVGGSDAKVNYKGKVADADTIKFDVEIEAIGQTIQFVAKRVP